MDKISNLSICCVGETLWDMLPTGKQPGGAPMNVSLHLHNLGVESYMLSRIGKDELGEELLAFLESRRCNTSYIQIDPDYSTGYVDVKLNEKKEATYSIVKPVAWDFIENSEHYVERVKNSQAIVFSTLVARSPVSKSTLLQLLTNSKAIRVYDVNVRPPHTPRHLIEQILPLSDIVKLNEDEFNEIADWYGYSKDKKGLQEIMIRFDLKYIILTRGENGAVLVSSDDWEETLGYKVKVIDTIGSGDAFLAGFLKCIFEKKSLSHSLDYACALGTLVASKEGATPYVSVEEIEQMRASNN
ncbi:MAG: carbohydrate kinase family protein [Leadbetterella sp.]